MVLFAKLLNKHWHFAIYASEPLLALTDVEIHEEFEKFDHFFSE